MTIKPNSGTGSVSRELLPCPFCGGNAGVPDHTDDCYFTLAAQLKTSSASDCSLAPAVLRAWNNRPQPADQQGEPVAWQWRRKTVQEGSQWTAWTDCAKGDYEACIASPQPSVRGIIREARRLYAAQPATAKVGGEVLEKLKELVSAVRSINRSPKHEIRVIGDDKPCYAQRKEWVEWLLSICDDADEVAKLNGEKL